jgi:serine/threonine-protein kinase
VYHNAAFPAPHAYSPIKVKSRDLGEIMSRDVFISHAGDDASVAVEVCAMLESRGLKCWMAPRDVAAGSVWDEAILDAIEASLVFLLILSKSANQSQYVKNEVNRAFSQSKPIVTFRLEDVPPGRSLELYLARHHWTDAFPPPMGARVERLATSITALLDPSATPAAAAPAATAPVRLTLGARLLSSLSALTKGFRELGTQALIFGLGTLLLGAGIAGFAAWDIKPTPPKPVTRAVINLPPGDRLVGPNQTALALSSDGKQLAYAAIRGATSQIYLRPMDSQEARPISGTEGAIEPFFSPDGQWIGFIADGKLKKISVNGGAAVTLADAENAVGASWSSQGTIAFAPVGTGSSLLQVLDSGGAPQPLGHFEKGETYQIWPQFLPGGKAVLFAGGNSGSGDHVIVQSAATGERRSLVGGTQPQYATSGHLIYAQGTTLMAVPFDPRRLEIKGTPVPVVEDVAYSYSYGSSQYSISDTGSLVYVSGGSQPVQRKMVWVSRNGVEQTLPVPAQNYRDVVLSPDGQRVAAEIDNQIWLYDLARDTLTRFTFEGNQNLSPVWTPDGKRIAFRSNKEGGAANIFWQRADGSGGLERLSTYDYLQVPKSWSPDGQFLAFHENSPKTGRDIWVLRMSDRKSQPFLVTPFNEGGPTFSPDGHWLAYVSNESGRPEVYVQPFPGPGGKWQISTEGGTEPAWNRNGKELFYRIGNKMMALDVTTQPGFSPGKPRMLFEGQYSASQWPLIDTAYDVSPDGQRFLMIKAADQGLAATQVNVVLNWFEELKQKVPTGKN